MCIRDRATRACGGLHRPIPAGSSARRMTWLTPRGSSVNPRVRPGDPELAASAIRRGRGRFGTGRDSSARGIDRALVRLAGGAVRDVAAAVGVIEKFAFGGLDRNPEAVDQHLRV